MRARRPRRRCGSAAARSPRPAAPDPCAAAPETRAQLRDRRQGRAVRPPAASSPPPCSATSAAISACPRTIPSSRRRCRWSTAARGSTASRSARQRQHHAGLVDLRQLHLSRRRGAAERLRLLPRQSERRLLQPQHAPRIPDPQAGDRLIQTPQPFGQPVHHLPSAVRARSSATASPIRAASPPISATCCSAPNISPTIS